jgi:hypothetical protein
MLATVLRKWWAFERPFIETLLSGFTTIEPYA